MHKKHPETSSGQAQPFMHFKGLYVRTNFILLALLSCFVFVACMKDDELWKRGSVEYRFPSQGLFVVNEGNFTYGNASLTYYDIAEKKAYNNVFYDSNDKLALGDVAQSMIIRDSIGYVVLNNSGKIYAIDVNTFKLKGKITGLTSPRNMFFVDSSKAYVTDLYAKAIAIVDPLNFEIVGYIDVPNNESMFYQHPTEEMVRYDKYIFTNCWSYDNKILVIDTETDAVVDSIEVPIQPISMVVDAFDKLWVLTDGGFEGSPYGYEEPALVRIDAETRSIEKVFRFELEDSPRDLELNGDGDTLYFINKHVYRHPAYLDRLPEMFIESPYDDAYSGGFYSLGVEPFSGDVYVADAKDNVQAGQVFRYDAKGLLVDSFATGIIPGAFCFK